MIKELIAEVLNLNKFRKLIGINKNYLNNNNNNNKRKYRLNQFKQMRE